MKVSYTTASGRLTFEVDVTSGKQAFKLVAAIQELFEEPACGACKSANIRCSAREHDGNSYYSLVCTACGAQLDFGQKKDGGTLFAKRKDKDGQVMPNRGWYQWQKRENTQADAHKHRNAY